MRKTTSTSHRNRAAVHYRCPLSRTLEKISGRWKPVILWQLMQGARNYSQLGKAVREASERVLARQLRELVSDGLVVRRMLSSSPLRTEYALSERGLSLKPALRALSAWGAEHLQGE